MMHFLISAIVFIIILALLVLAHEFGHFIVAKKSGMEVKEFGFGFPPRIFGIKKGETTYSVNWLPLGGFVKITGEDGEEADLSAGANAADSANAGDAANVANRATTGNPRSFVNKGFWARFGTLIAGVVMNVILAWFLFSIGFMFGLPTAVVPGEQLPAHAYVRSQSISILDTSAGSPAANAGLQTGDKILLVDGRQFADLDSLVNFVHAQEGKTVDLEISRGNRSMDFKVLARQNPPAGQGSLGVDLGYVGLLYFHPWYYSFYEGIGATWQVVQETANGIYQIFVSHQGLGAIGGPVKIASLTGQVTTLGIAYIINFTALLSVNLAILNVIPFPALDGGRILFLLIEKIRGKKNNRQVEQWFNMIGFAILILLIVLVSIRDVGTLIKK